MEGFMLFTEHCQNIKAPGLMVSEEKTFVCVCGGGGLGVGVCFKCGCVATYGTPV